MKYSEMIELYKNGTLDDSKKHMLEADIERQTAISDYLYENEQIPPIIEDETAPTDEEKQQSIYEKKQLAKKKEIAETEKFMKLIRANIRRSFLKFSVALVAMVVAVMLVCGWILTSMPEWERGKYYDPIRSADGTENYHFRTEIEDYSETFAPDKVWRDLDFSSLGGGDYSLTVEKLERDRTISGYESDRGDLSDVYAGKFISGRISKGTIEVYGDNVFSPEASYPFATAMIGVENLSASRSAGRMDNFGSYDEAAAKKSLKDKAAALDRNGRYNVYITFDKVYTIDQAAAVLYDQVSVNGQYDDVSADVQRIWFALCQKKNDAFEASGTIGFCAYNDISMTDASLGETYKKMANKHSTDMYRTETVNDISRVVTKRLRDLAQQKDFLMMMGCSDIQYFEMDGRTVSKKNPHSAEERYECESKYLKEFADNLETNGVYSYGCYCSDVSGEFISRLAADGTHVAYISVEEA